ncbi:hypothetical protein CCMA1212_002184 [Trichoderma ghanense]|uniref:Uncharacterized protein n=1 Tax=Trichoderma ghanense TaxID=65468 RepID=A0ABY2HB65_9HYPO
MTKQKREREKEMLTIGQTTTKKKKDKLPATMFPAALTDQKPDPCAPLNDTHAHTHIHIMTVGKSRLRRAEEAHETSPKMEKVKASRKQRVGRNGEEHLRLQLVVLMERGQV